MPRPKNKLIIIDGNALIHRSYHAMPPLTSKGGELVNAVYGFALVLLKMFKDLKPTHVVVCFDRPEKTFRDQEFAEYKAKRVKAPQDLYNQIPRVKELVQSFNIPTLEKPGFEADDLIGTITAVTPGTDKVIVTGDQDTLQLVDEETKVYTMRKGMSETMLMDETAVKERFGVNPKQLVDYKGLRGDPSDNIPGVKGIGEKTASDLLKTFGSVEKLYAELKAGTKKAMALKEAVREKLLRDKEMAFLSKRIATIVRNVPIDFDFHTAARKNYDRRRVVEFLKELGFSSFLSRLPENEGEKPAAESADMPAAKSATSKFGEEYTLVATEKDFANFLKFLRRQPAFTFDTETTSLDPIDARLLGISFSWEEGKAHYVSLQDDWLKQLRPMLEDPKVKKHGHNMKYDINALHTAGVDVHGAVFDTMIASYVLNSGTRAHGLNQVVFEELGHEMQPIEALIGPRGKSQLPLESVPVDKLAWYSCEDADFTERLVEKLGPKLEAGNVRKLFDEIEQPLVPVLARMERSGVKIDVPFLKTMSQQLARKLSLIESEIHEMAGLVFNVASPIQLKEVLFQKLELSTKGIGKTKTGISTAADQLDKLRDVHPIVPKILEFRELSKLKSTYLDALPELIHKKTGRVHTSFNQTVAATGRLSSSDPNLQNIPIRTELGAKIRNAFIADRGKRILAADYSQFELRIAASIANVRKMIESFRQNEDIHARTAAEIQGVPLDKVTKDIRRTAKEVNFGVLYGMGAGGLAQRQGIEREKARAFIEKYFLVYKELSEWLETTVALARKMGYAETLFGRRRYLPELKSYNPMIRAGAERMATNMPIQGTQADLIKIAMIRVDALLPKISPESKMILQVHDELVFEVPEKDAIKVGKMVKETMEGVYKLRVPVVVDVEVGRSWGEKKRIEV